MEVILPVVREMTMVASVRWPWSTARDEAITLMAEVDVAKVAANCEGMVESGAGEGVGDVPGVDGMVVEADELVVVVVVGVVCEEDGGVAVVTESMTGSRFNVGVGGWGAWADLQIWKELRGFLLLCSGCLGFGLSALRSEIRGRCCAVYERCSIYSGENKAAKKENVRAPYRRGKQLFYVLTDKNPRNVPSTVGSRVVLVVADKGDWCL